MISFTGDDFNTSLTLTHIQPVWNQIFSLHLPIQLEAIMFSRKGGKLLLLVITLPTGLGKTGTVMKELKGCVSFKRNSTTAEFFHLTFKNVRKYLCTFTKGSCILLYIENLKLKMVHFYDFISLWHDNEGIFCEISAHKQCRSIRTFFVLHNIADF